MASRGARCYTRWTPWGTPEPARARPDPCPMLVLFILAALAYGAHRVKKGSTIAASPM